MRYFKSALIWLPSVFFMAGIAVASYYIYKAGLDIASVVIIVWYFINLIITNVIFIQYRNETAKLSWFFVINMLPIFGHILFLIFGQRYASRKEIKDYHQSYGFAFEKKQQTRLNYSTKAKSILTKTSQIANRGIYQTNVQLFQYGEEGFDKMFDDILNAKEFIHIQFYIIKPGEIYDHFRSLLVKKAHEGVKIRFIVDDFGHWAMPNYELTSLRNQGIEIGIFGKVNFPFIGSENGYRTHRKMIIIDGKIVHTGGLNIADEYASLNHKYGMWIDFQARITGEFVRSYSLLFIQDWFLVKQIKLDPQQFLKEEKKGDSHAVLLEDSPENKIPILQDTIVNLIANAQSEIHLATPYLILSIQLLAALRTAALSGVKVYIYIPGLADKKSVLSASHYYANLLQKCGAIIYEARNMMFHSKIALFDNEYAYFGTANLDVRSFYSQFEFINLVVGKDVATIKLFFDYYQKLSRRVDEHEFDAHGSKDKLRRIFVNLFSPIM